MHNITDTPLTYFIPVTFDLEQLSISRMRTRNILSQNSDWQHIYKVLHTHE